MRNTHEPEDAFVHRLEAQITSEVRRRNQSGEPRRWALQPPSRLAAAAGLAAIVLVSMGIGGAVVAAAYQAENNLQRNLLVTAYEQRLNLAKQSLALTETAHRGDKVRLDVGLMAWGDLMEGRIKVAAAQAQVQTIELQLAEVRLTGREPVNEISAPLVAGRDFVSERLRIDMSVPIATLEFEKVLLRDLQIRVEIGTQNPIDLQAVRTQIAEFEVAIDTFRRKLEIRQSFLKGVYTAIQADLRVLEADAERQRRVLLPKIEMAKLEVDRIKAQGAVGTATEIELLKAKLNLQQLNLDLSKAEVDLAMVRQRLTGK